MKNLKFLAMLLFAALASSAWAGVIIIEAEDQTISDATTWTGGTIIIAGDGSITYSSRITISGSVKLNIGEGSTLIVPKGIEVDEGNTLTIEGNGALNASADKFYAAIGSGYYDDVPRTSGTIDIKNGKITATGGQFAAGIGGGSKGGCGVINISGGQVTANAGDDASGIGPGADGETSGIVTLGWSNEDDFIYASNYNNVSTVVFEENKQFYFVNGETTCLASVDNIGGQKLQPYMESVEIGSESPKDKSGVAPVVVSGLKVLFARNELTVTASSSEVKVYVFDLQGNLKKQYHGHSAGTHYLSLNQMNRGVYLVRVVSGSNVRTLRAQVK